MHRGPAGAEAAVDVARGGGLCRRQIGLRAGDVGTGFEGGLAVVILAVLLDRITQSFGQKRPALVPGLRALFARKTQGEDEAKQGGTAARLASH